MKPRPVSSLFSSALSRAALIGTLIGCAPNLVAFQPLGQRWTNTATNGFMGSSAAIRGNATTLTWGFADEGTAFSGGTSGTGTNNLISTLNTKWGAPTTVGDHTTAAWFSMFDDAYERWEQLSGVTMTYEANDDGAVMGSGGTTGVLGTRADMRIGGRSIDGAIGSNTLAFNYSPNNGDQVMDTDNIVANTYGTAGGVPANGTNNATRFQNVNMHEAGHGLGLGHLDSNNSQQLLEPFINVNFWGPQLDDILGLQRLYGDAWESAGGNDATGSATALGTITSGGSASIGALGDTAVVARTDTDFISIDGASDMDFFSFTVASAGTVNVTLDPRGATYNEGPEGGTETALVTDSLSNLQFQLIAADGTTVLATGSGGAAGINEMVNSVALTAGGTYFIKVGTETGATDNVQLYGLDVDFTALLAGDGNIWDINGVTAGAGGTTPSGNWSGTSNWTTENTNTAAGGNTATAAWNNNGTTGNVAVFSAGTDATGTYTVNSDLAGVVLTGVTVEEGDVVISGAQSLALNAAPTGTSVSGHNQGGANVAQFFISGGTSLDVQVALTDDGTAGDGISKNSGGFLQLSGANTYTGITNVTGGELRITGSTTSDTTAFGGTTLSGTGVIDGDLTMGANSNFNPGSGATGNLTVTGTGNTVTFDDNANLNFELATPFATKAAAAQSGDHLTIGGGNSLIFDGNLNITDVGGFASGFYELVSVDVANETINFTNDSSDFTGVPNTGYAYRIESGSIDLVVADTPDVLFGNGSNVLNLNLGNFAIGAGGTAGYNIENALGTELLRLFADDIAVTSTSGMTGLFGSGYSGTAFDLNGGDSIGLTASFLGAGAGSYNASYTFGWEDFLAAPGALGNITGLLAGNGTDVISGDFYLPEDYLAGNLTLNLFATVGAVPEPSRAVLLLMGLSSMLLRRRRS